MAFFGLTTLGESEGKIHDATAPSKEWVFHTIDETQYEATFNKYLLGDSQTATVLQVDGSTHVLRASLADMLRELLQRQPRRYELEAWFTHLDFDRSSTISAEEFMKGVRNLLVFSADPQLPKQYQSYGHLHEHWVRHVRHDFELQRTQRTPVTTAQEVGWHTLKPAPADKRYSLNSTDVTRNEGRNLATYYGQDCTW